MKDTIREIYKDILVDDVKTFDFNNYDYFIEKNNRIFGLLKNNISVNEKKLILSHFNSFNPEDLYDDSYQLLEYLFGVEPLQIEYEKLKYYLIKIEGLEDEFMQSELYRLLKESYNQNAYVTKRENIFIIISEIDDNIEFDHLLQSIESDFLVKVVGYASELHEVNDYLPAYFQFDFNCFKNYPYSHHLFITKVQLLLNVVFKDLNEDLRNMLKSYILRDNINDKEMLSVIKVYFESNFNSTLASKRCYMHRNTFLNKLDKFIQRTNLNLKNYDEAFIVYMALIL